MTERRTWSEFRWDLWAQLYDPLTRGLQKGRARAVELAQISSGDAVLIPGAGTGLDLPLLPAGVSITAVEQSPPMIERLQRRARELRISVNVIQGDAASIELPPSSFDVVLLHLILAVVDAPHAVLREAARLVRRDGRIIVFDKFAPDDRRPSIPRRLFNRVSRVVATDVTVQLGPLAEATGCRIVHREAAAFGGVFQVAVLNKIQD